MTSRSERFIIAGMIVGMCLILLTISIFKPNTAPVLYPLIATWMGGIITWLKAKSDTKLKLKKKIDNAQVNPK